MLEVTREMRKRKGENSAMALWFGWFLRLHAISPVQAVPLTAINPNPVYGCSVMDSYSTPTSSMQHARDSYSAGTDIAPE